MWRFSRLYIVQKTFYRHFVAFVKSHLSCYKPYADHKSSYKWRSQLTHMKLERLKHSIFRITGVVINEYLLTLLFTYFIYMIRWCFYKFHLQIEGWSRMRQRYFFNKLEDVYNIIVKCACWCRRVKYQHHHSLTASSRSITVGSSNHPSSDWSSSMSYWTESSGQQWSTSLKPRLDQYLTCFLDPLALARLWH